ncbi:MAG: 4Fe-4S binding protein [Candidatus Altiarchaeota archaeon]|nr:4Fe-4S binding protein [Candidatus Altiarchaeota archaeon]
MKQLTIISGKGGTGKTSIMGAFASLAKDKVLADCDVDAADLHLLLQPKVLEESDFRALKTAEIDPELCIGCGKCAEYCRWNAIEKEKDGKYTVNPLSCEGCAVCTLVCPAEAITMKEKVAGKTYISETRHGPLCHARLNPGEEASGKLIAEVRNDASRIARKKGLDLIMIDGSPGIGCPVIASITGVNMVLVVTEPTVSGIHDLERVLDVAEHFKIKALVCVNKCDINPGKTGEIEEYCKSRGIEVAGRITYDPVFTKAQIEGKTLPEYAPASPVAKEVEGLWEKVAEALDV